MEAWGPLSTLFYFEDYLRVYRGRGLPVPFDSEVVARSQGKDKGNSGKTPAAVVEEAAKGVAGRVPAQQKDDAVVSLATQMGEMLKAQQEMMQSLSSMSGQVSKLQSEVTKLKENPPTPGREQPFVPFMKRTCHH